MANGEVFVQAEGTLSMVQASASAGGASGARVWATAATPSSAVNMGYVQSFSFTSAQQITTVRNRDLPTHHKQTMKDPIQLTFNLLWTGSITAVVSAPGATMPMAHIEFKAIEPVLGTATGGNSVGSGRYYQFYGVAFQQMQFTENADGDTIQMTCVALGMSGANTSGYLS